MTAADTQTYQAKRAELEAAGYVEIDEYAGIRPGVHVHNRKERYAAAYEHGTGEVLAVFQKHDSPWSRKWEHDDVEVLVARFHERFAGHRVTAWADYGTRIARQQPAAASR